MIYVVINVRLVILPPKGLNFLKKYAKHNMG